jgi:hypothetical protein
MRSQEKFFSTDKHLYNTVYILEDISLQRYRVKEQNISLKRCRTIDENILLLECREHPSTVHACILYLAQGTSFSMDAELEERSSGYKVKVEIILLYVCRA